MTRSRCAAIVAAVLLTTSASPASAQWDTLMARMALVTDDVLSRETRSDQPGVVASDDCDIRADEVAKFDALLTLTNSEQEASKKTHARWGLPFPTKPISDEQPLVHREYIVNYNRNVRIPTYAIYLLTASDVVPAGREKCFREDPRLDVDARSVLADYAEPIFDRGHLVPRSDMNRSQAVMINTFVLSNMMPQHDQFNRGIWKTLETAVRAWTTDKGRVVIITGAVFDADENSVRDVPEDIKRVRPTKRVGIPTHFYKIVLHERSSGFVDAIAIMLPHNEKTKGMQPVERLAYLEEHIVSISDIEAVTGYDFLPNMPPMQQRAVKRAIASGLWQ